MEKQLPKGFSRETRAASAQYLLEEICSKYVQHWVSRTGCRDVALAGGVFANVKLNQRIHELKNVDSVFVHPGMGDEGLALGAGLALASRSSGNGRSPVRPRRLDGGYWGPNYDRKQVAAAIRRTGLTCWLVEGVG